MADSSNGPVVKRLCTKVHSLGRQAAGSSSYATEQLTAMKG